MWDNHCHVSPSLTSDLRGTLLSKIPQEVLDAIMAIGLILFCLILSYIFWQLHLGILNIVTIVWIIILMVKTMGPAWVYSMLWYMIGWIWYLLPLVWTHPYISFVIFLILRFTTPYIIFFTLRLIATYIPFVIFFTLHLITPIQSCLAHCRRKGQCDTIESTVLNISMRLSRVMERQADGVHSVQVNIAVLAEEVQQLKTIVHSSAENICTIKNEVHGLKTTLDKVHPTTNYR